MIISVIIPCYNMEAYIERAIKSVLDQTFRNWQLIVVDDGSTDGSWAAIERALGTDPRCTGIRTDNHGVAAARNLAIDRAGDGLIVPLLGTKDKMLRCARLGMIYRDYKKLRHE